MARNKATAIVRRAGAGGAQVRKISAKGWTKAKRRTFIDALAQTCNVTLAAEKARKAVSSAYHLRNTDEGFRVAWLEALDQGYEMLELQALERARNGVREVVTVGGKTTERTVFSDTLTTSLLRHHQQTVAAYRASRAPIADTEELIAELLARIERLSPVRESGAGGEDRTTGGPAACGDPGGDAWESDVAAQGGEGDMTARAEGDGPVARAVAGVSGVAGDAPAGGRAAGTGHLQAAARGDVPAFGGGGDPTAAGEDNATARGEAVNTGVAAVAADTGAGGPGGAQAGAAAMRDAA